VSTSRQLNGVAASAAAKAHGDKTPCMHMEYEQKLLPATTIDRPRIDAFDPVNARI
jgi:hypothetical protein